MDNKRPHDQHCERCDLAEFSGQTYDSAHRCGAVMGKTRFLCDREWNHTGSHRTYLEAVDEVVFWGHKP